MIPCAGKALRPRAPPQPIGAHPRHPHGPRCGSHRSGEVELGEEGALPQLAPPVAPMAQRHGPKEGRLSADTMGGGVGHAPRLRRARAGRKMVLRGMAAIGWKADIQITQVYFGILDKLDLCGGKGSQLWYGEITDQPVQAILTDPHGRFSISERTLCSSRNWPKLTLEYSPTSTPTMLT